MTLKGSTARSTTPAQVAGLVTIDPPLTFKTGQSERMGAGLRHIVTPDPLLVPPYNMDLFTSALKAYAIIRL